MAYPHEPESDLDNHGISSDAYAPVDRRLDTPQREGLSGTAPASLYDTMPAREQITIAPDGKPPEAQPQWRQDFPVDWPQDQYVARRDFAKFMVLTSFAFVVGQLWIGIKNILRRRTGQLPITRVVSLDDIHIGSTLVFNYPDMHNPCLLLRTGPQTLLAYSQACTHLSCAVVPQIEKDCIHCPCHEGYFDLASGRPTAGPPQRPLDRILIELKQGVVYATGVERRTV